MLTQLVSVLGGSGLNMFAPGSSGGIGTMGSTVSQLNMQRSLFQGGQQLMQDINMFSARTQYFTNPLSRAFPGDAARQNISAMMGGLLNNSFLTPYIGGSDFDLGFGLQNLTNASGFRINGTRSFGGGPLSDAVTMNLFKSVQAKMFDGPGGLSNLNMTYGMDRTEIAQIASLVGQRGGFTGQNLGDLTKVIGTDTLSTKGLDSYAVDKITSTISKTAQTLRAVRDIVGSRPMAELMQITEGLTGMSGGSANFNKAAMGMITTTMGVSSAYGFDPRASLEMQSAMVSNFKSMGWSGAAAGPAALAAWQSAAIDSSVSADAARQMQSGGIFSPARTMAQAAGQRQMQMGMIAKNPQMLALLAGHLMVERGMLGGAERDAMSAMINNSDPSDKDLNNILVTANKKFGGVNNFLSSLGGADAAAGLLDPSGGGMVFSNQMNSVLNRRGTNDRLAMTLQSMQISRARTDAVINLRNSVETTTGVAVGQILAKGGSRADVLAALRGDSGADQMTNSQLTSFVDRLMSGGKVLGQDMNTAKAVQDADPLGMAQNNSHDRASAARMAAAKMQQLYGDTTPTGTVLDNLLQGIISGKSEMTGSAVMGWAQKMKADGKAVDGMVSFGGGNTAAQDKASLRAMMVATGNEGGVDDMWKQLQGGNRDKAMETLAEQAAASGGAFVGSKEKGYNFISGSAIGGIRSQAQQAQSAYLLDDLVGKVLPYQHASYGGAVVENAIIKASLSSDDGVKAKLAMLNQDNGDMVKQVQAARIAKDMATEADDQAKPEDRAAAKKEREALTGAMAGEMNFIGKLTVDAGQLIAYLAKAINPPGTSTHAGGHAVP